MHTGVGKQFHAQPSHPPFGEAQSFWLRNASEQQQEDLQMSGTAHAHALTQV